MREAARYYAAHRLHEIPRKTVPEVVTLETAVEVNHESHERPENKGSSRGWPTVDYLTRLMMTPNSARPSPFVPFVPFVVPTVFFGFTERLTAKREEGVCER